MALDTRSTDLLGVVHFVLIFLLFEGVIAGGRYLLNDFKDAAEDQQRGLPRKLWVLPERRRIVLITALARTFIGLNAASLFGVGFFLVGLSFVLLQFFYDHVAKPYLPFFSVLTVAAAYPVRSLSVLFGLGLHYSPPLLAALLGVVFFHAMFCALTWRRHESEFFERIEVVAKPHADFFMKPRAIFLISVTEYLFLTFVMLWAFLMTGVEPKYVWGISISLILRAGFGKSVPSLFEKMRPHVATVFLIVFCCVLLRTAEILFPTVVLLVPLLLTWYRFVYMPDFAHRYYEHTRNKLTQSPRLKMGIPIRLN